MVRIYTWLPTDVEDVVDAQLLPDVGHLAIELVGEDGTPQGYASFWPERGSLIGRLTRFWKPRPVRHPESYLQECDPEGGYMQRPADHVDEVTGLEEAFVLQSWLQLRDGEYDFAKWNCSNVGKFLLVCAVPGHLHPRLEEAKHCSTDDLTRLAGGEELSEKLRYLATSPFIDCRPEDVRRLAQEFAAWAHG